MKLHYHPGSHNSRRASSVIHHLKANVELVVVDVTKGAHKTPEFLKMNPNGMVPVLEDNGFILTESIAIMQYVCEKFDDTQLWPKDLQARADVNRWLFWHASHWNSAIGTLIFEKMFKKMIGQGDAIPELVKNAEAHVQRFGAVLNGHLETREFVSGKNWTLADFAIGSALTYKDQAGVPISSFKHILNWWDRLNKVEGWKKSAPPQM